MTKFDLVDLTQPIEKKTDPTFTVRMAEATLLRAQAAEVESRLDDEEPGFPVSQATKTVWAAERELLLAKADYIDYLRDEGDPMVQTLVRIAEALENMRFRA